jgi:hypothetical protein
MLISRQFGDEVILANYASGIYYNLDGTGAQIWLGIHAGKTVEQIVDGFFAATEADRSVIDQGVRDFVDHLLKEGIIIQSHPASDSKDSLPLISGQFTMPRLERFADLRDPLLLDPIHDVGENRWRLRGGNARQGSSHTGDRPGFRRDIVAEDAGNLCPGGIVSVAVEFASPALARAFLP